MKKTSEVIGILIALAALVVSIFTWLMPFEPVSTSPLSSRDLTEDDYSNMTFPSSTTPSSSTNLVPIITVIAPNDLELVSINNNVIWLDRRTAYWQGAVNLSVDETLPFIQEALKSIEATSRFAEQSKIRVHIIGKIDFSWESSGEEIDVVLEDSAEMQGYPTLITITSQSSSFVIVDAISKNEKNINDIINFLATQ